MRTGRQTQVSGPTAGHSPVRDVQRGHRFERCDRGSIGTRRRGQQPVTLSSGENTGNKGTKKVGHWCLGKSIAGHGVERHTQLDADSAGCGRQARSRGRRRVFLIPDSLTWRLLALICSSETDKAETMGLTSLSFEFVSSFPGRSSEAWPGDSYQPPRAAHRGISRDMISSSSVA